jgi:prepilin-type N-terminal cleavage/methylation domain-containing protein
MFRLSTAHSSSSPPKKSLSGFTLAEVLVTLAIIAVMAAVLLPALNQQLAKGDTGKLASDLTSIQTASQAFLSDVHRYPDSVAQLTTGIGATSQDINGTFIPATLLPRWKGPYLGRESLNTTGGGLTIAPAFSKVTSSGTSYLTIGVTGTPALGANDFSNLEAVLDEGTTGNSSSTGSVRQSGTTTILFLALPIQ